MQTRKIHEPCNLPVVNRRQARADCRRTLCAMNANARVGHGFDLHRLEAGLPLILGGVPLEHDRGCAGHSDGDAVYHCVVDAILGALSLPDIGQLFPDTDPRYHNAASHAFMTAACEQMKSRGYVVGNVDVTIILERPKLSPHKQNIRKNIAELLEANVECINVKAKTHEKVDAVGENRAVAVHAVALLVPSSTEYEDIPGAAAAAEVSDPSLTGSVVANRILQVVSDRVEDTFKTARAPSEPEKDPVQRLYDTVVSRRGADPSSSWTAKLFSKGRAKIAQKVGEEAVEVVIAATDGDSGGKEGVIKESADLLYHLSVLWADLDVSPDDIWQELRTREGVSGVAEKLSRAKS